MPHADLEQTFLTETHLKLNTWTRIRRTYRGHLLSFHLKQISLQKLIFATLTGPPSKFSICIENAKMKKLKMSVFGEIHSAKTDVLENADFFDGEQIKNLDRQKKFFTKIQMVNFCMEFGLKTTVKSQMSCIFLHIREVPYHSNDI